MKAKPPNAGKGRPVGSKNKVSRDIRQYVLDVAAKLEKEGRGLYQWAVANPDDFWGKVFKAVVPKEVDANVQGSVTITVETGIDRAPND